MSTSEAVPGVVAIAAAVAAGERRAEDVVAEHLARADAGRGLNALLQVTRESAIERARAIDARRQAGGTLGRLAGVDASSSRGVGGRFLVENSLLGH